MITTVLQILGTTCIWIIGAKNIITGNMTIGIVMALMNYQNMIVSPILDITNFYNEFHTAKESLNNINFFFNEKDEDLETGFKITDINNIKVSNLEYSYNKNTILNISNVEFKKGNIYVLKGSSGQGKSTLMDILTANINNYKGNILIDGIDLRKINLSSYRTKISYSMQYPNFYYDFFEENLNTSQKARNVKIFNIDPKIFEKK